jgi:hypothetical protein
VDVLVSDRPRASWAIAVKVLVPLTRVKPVAAKVASTYRVALVVLTVTLVAALVVQN